MVNEEDGLKTAEGLIDLSDEDEVNDERPESLKEKFDELYADDVAEAMEKKEEEDEVVYEVLRASKKRLKERLMRRFDIHVLIDERVENGKKVKEVITFETRKPTDKEKIELERLGAGSTQELKKLSDEDYEKSNNMIAQYLSKMVLDPHYTAEEWRTEVEQPIYQTLFFKLIAASAQTNEAQLIDFFERV